jgi:hypothetical protein
MKKFINEIEVVFKAMFLVGVMVFVFGAFTTTKAYACTDLVNFNATQPNAITTIPVSVVGANATFTIPAGSCPLKISFSSYSHNGTIMPFENQVLFDNITNTYGPGTYHIGPLKLACNWQTDLYAGDVQTHLNPVYGTANYIQAQYVEHQVCAPLPATLHIIKQVVNNDGGTSVASSFTLHVKLSGTDVSGSPAAGAGAPGTSYSLAPGTYTVSENTNASYSQSFSGDCNSSGNVTLASGDNKTCTMINDDIPVPPPGCTNLVNFNATQPNAITTIPVSVVGANATFTIPAGSCPLKISFSSYSHNGTILPFENQVLFDNITNTYGPGTYHIGPLALACNWQTDLYAGDVQTHLNPVYGTANYIQAQYVEHQICSTPPPPPPPQSCTSNCGSEGGPLLVPPVIHVTDVADPISLLIGPGLVTYRYAVSNAGTMAMSNVTANDNKCSPLVFVSGDTNNDSNLDTNEVWNYTCTTTVPQTTTSNVVASGQANGSTVTDTADATVLVSAPSLPNTGTPLLTSSTIVPGFPKTGFSPFGENGQWNFAIILGDAMVVLISFYIVLKKRTI